MIKTSEHYSKYELQIIEEESFKHAKYVKPIQERLEKEHFSKRSANAIRLVVFNMNHPEKRRKKNKLLR